MALNKVMLIGNVGKDPEVRYLESSPAAQGVSSQQVTPPKVAQFTLATTERYHDRNGQQRENTEWHNIVTWRGLADTVEKFVRKGMQLYVEGSLRTRSWTDHAGVKQYRTEIVADNVQLLGRRSDNPGAQQDSGYGRPAGYAQGGNRQQGTQDGYVRQSQMSQPEVPVQSTASSAAIPDDDLPF